MHVYSLLIILVTEGVFLLCKSRLNESTDLQHVRISEKIYKITRQLCV